MNKMKHLLSLSISILLLCHCSSSEPAIKSLYDINEDTTLKKGHLYSISAPIIISKSAKLTIEEGVELILTDSGRVLSEGLILANGTKQNPIKITSYNNGSLKINSQDNRLNVLEGLEIKNTYFVVNKSSVAFLNNGFKVTKKLNGAIIHANNSKVNIESSLFFGNGETEGVGVNRGDFFINDNYFDSIPDAIEISNATDGKICLNTIKNSTDDGIDLNNCKRTIITNNQILNTKDKAISIGNKALLNEKDVIQISHNVIKENGIGIAIKQEANAVINHTLFIRNRKAILVDKKSTQDNKNLSSINYSTLFKNKENIHSTDNYTLLFNNCTSDVRLNGTGNTIKESYPVNEEEFLKRK